MNLGQDLMNLFSVLLVYLNVITIQPQLLPAQLGEGKLANCLFCNVTQDRFRIVFEDANLVAFHDIDPSSSVHIQLIPKAHTGSIRTLGKDDVSLLKSMKDVGHRILDDFHVPTSNRKLGFHIPPFNSIEHLHMHVLGLPYTHFTRRRKYPVNRGRKGYSKGFSWFVDVQQAIDILERGRHVEVWAC